MLTLSYTDFISRVLSVWSEHAWVCVTKWGSISAWGGGGQGSPQEFLIANVMVYFLGLKNGGVGRDQASPLWLLSLLSIAA